MSPQWGLPVNMTSVRHDCVGGRRRPGVPRARYEYVHVDLRGDRGAQRGRRPRPVPRRAAPERPIEGARDRGRVQRLHRSDRGRRSGIWRPGRRDRDPRASKTAALNLGDARVSGFPRFYVDADVMLPLASIRRIAASPRRGRCSGSVTRHGRRSAGVEPGRPRLLSDLEAVCRTSARA